MQTAGKVADDAHAHPAPRHLKKLNPNAAADEDMGGDMDGETVAAQDGSSWQGDDGSGSDITAHSGDDEEGGGPGGDANQAGASNVEMSIEVLKEAMQVCYVGLGTCCSRQQLRVYLVW